MAEQKKKLWISASRKAGQMMKFDGVADYTVMLNRESKHHFFGFVSQKSYNPVPRPSLVAQFLALGHE